MFGHNPNISETCKSPGGRGFFLFYQKSSKSLKSSFHLTAENSLSQLLTELYAFLVETVYIPYEALEHYFVFVVSEQCTK